MHSKIFFGRKTYVSLFETVNELEDQLEDNVESVDLAILTPEPIVEI
jgi:hypothetical protein